MLIADLLKILGPQRRGALYRYFAWLLAYGVLEGLAVTLLVPVLRALLAQPLDMGALTGWLLALGGVVLCCCIARYQQSMQGFNLALVVLTSLHRRLGDHVATLPLGWFSGERIGRLSQSATNGTLMVTNIFAHLLTPVVTGLVTPCIIALAMLIFDWRLGLCALLSAPLILLAHRRASAAIGRTEEAVDHAAAQAGSRVVEFARQQPALRAFGQALGSYPPLEAAITAQKQAGGSMLDQTFPRLFASGLAVQLAFLALILTGLALAASGAADPAGLVALLVLAARFAGPLTETAARSGLLRMAGNDLRRLAAIFDEKPLPEPAEPARMDQPGSIAFDEVHFGYDPAQPVLRGLSFQVPSGSMVAIVGASGAGKSTIIRLIMRFFDVQAGAVRVGGADVREVATADLMAAIATVTQDVYLFDGTLEQAVRLGRADATEAELRHAADLAGVTEIVARLPQGWQTRVGEGGALLSGGERQRVSVARALLKQAPILLLDEATAALDPENERYVQRSIAALRGRATVLVIAHRLRTVSMADRILVLADGHVAEAGSHAELMQAGGAYAAFWHERQRAEGWRLLPRDQPMAPARDQPSP
ncbi:ABC transporter ATP-binding protein [Niveispirillum irakense]|uniref:ABC transporter ATP-binding protein n=1 Tax=Niveispirillum irakense TaxID=34011 RepID=UPI0003FC8191|nr:ABC transporter ATP-binding protein [Niveispirillum irakense]